MNEYTSADAIASLRKAGVPVTHQRIEIAKVLFSAPVHLSADQVWANVRDLSPDVSRATVYNTLRLFSEKKMIRELFVDPQRVVYDSTTTPHHHLYNMDTGEVCDVSDEELQVVGRPKLPEGVVLDEIDVIVRVRNRMA
ncbi:Fur family transcriptional regulator [Thauera sp. WH-2]|jgi:Fur family iron response transcriptional regulator|uniref:Fur family transcriptional regulator n=1 Tax=unclassified Thauera TaxID=2609274 RepID=UPI003AAFFB58